MPPADRDAFNLVDKVLHICEPYHAKWLERARRRYRLYRSYKDWHDRFVSTPRGVDRRDLREDAQRTYGTELFVPMCFRTVEAVVPRILSNAPEMVAEPLDPESEETYSNAEFVVNSQISDMNYELRLQTIGKNALIYGLGIQKVGWDKRYGYRTRLVPSMQPTTQNPSGLAEERMYVCTHDDPDIAAVDPADFLWDPYGASINGENGAAPCGYVIHRTWRTIDYIAEKVQSGAWRNLTSIEEANGLGSNDKYWEVMNERWAIDGQSAPIADGDQRHEVLEYWDDDQVIIVLDRAVVVQAGPNPYWHGEKPFQVYRPTIVPHRLEGIGEVEPIEDLQEEINALRSDRRDNARLILQKVIAFHEGPVDSGDLQWGPGVGIPVNGDPRELIFPIQIGDIPYAGFEEEDRLKDDFQLTSGMSDLMTGGAPTGTDETATGAQIGQSASMSRIVNKVKLIEMEMIEPGIAQMDALDQQMRLTPRPMREASEANIAGGERRRYEWREITPLDRSGAYRWKVKSGSTEAENKAMKMQNARDLFTLFNGDSMVDQYELKLKTLKDLGVPNAEALLVQPQPEVPAEVLDMIVQEVAASQGEDAAEEVSAIIRSSIKQVLPIMAGEDAPAPPSEEPSAV